MLLEASRPLKTSLMVQSDSKETLSLRLATTYAACRALRAISVSISDTQKLA